MSYVEKQLAATYFL